MPPKRKKAKLAKNNGGAKTAGNSESAGANLIGCVDAVSALLRLHEKLCPTHIRKEEDIY
jgi:hypothetical protein